MSNISTHMNRAFSYLSAAVLALGVAGTAHAQNTRNDFAIGQAGTPTSFTFNGTRYTENLTGVNLPSGPTDDIGPGETVNLVSFVPTQGLWQTSPNRVAYTLNDSPSPNSYWYGFARQPNSVLVGFLDDSSPTTQNYFVKDIVGTNATTSDLPGSSNTYVGPTVWHHPVNEGTVNYTITNAGGGAWNGQGTFSGLQLTWSFGGPPITINLSGTLANTPITAQTIAGGADGNYLGVHDANATITTGNVLLDAAIVAAYGTINPKYDLAVFGTGSSAGDKATDVAGRLTLNDRLGSFGLTGVR